MGAIYNSYNFIMSHMLEEGQVGGFKLVKTTIPIGTVMHIYNRHAGKITKGKYELDYPIIKLEGDGHCWMSDAQLEVESVAGAVDAARGDVLIGGLGIGLLPTLIKEKVSVKSIDIVELHQEVTDLVFHQIATAKMRVACDDIFHYLDTTDKRYDFIHIDIWNDITAPIGEMGDAIQRAQRCLKPDGTVWCWLQELYDRIKEKLPKTPTRQTSSSGVHEPCLICGKTVRFDYAGLCMDCADDMELSEMYVKKSERR